MSALVERVLTSGKTATTVDIPTLFFGVCKLSAIEPLLATVVIEGPCAGIGGPVQSTFSLSADAGGDVWMLRAATIGRNAIE